MGFYNIYTEGQQAEEYKARKAKEAEEKEKAEAERHERRKNANHADFENDSNDQYTKKIHNYINADKVVSDDHLRRSKADADAWIDKSKAHEEFLQARDISDDAERRVNNASQGSALRRFILKNERKEAESVAKDAKEKLASAERKYSDAKQKSDQKYKEYANSSSNYHTSLDAVQKHMRRHPDQWEGSKRIKTRSEACGIFESVEFLND